MFDGETELWYNVKAETDHGVVLPRSYHAAVNVYQTESDRKCKCKEAMLVFGGSQLWDVKYTPKGESNKTFNDLWELRCVGSGYRWIQLSSSTNSDVKKPSKRYMPSSASSHDVMYIFGGCYFGTHEKCIPYNDLWSYNIGLNEWQPLAALQPAGGLVRLAFVNRRGYKSFDRENGLVLCCRKPFYFYDTRDRKWYPLDMLSSDENYFDLVDSSVAVVQGNVIVYGGGDHPRWLIQDDLWNVTVLSNSVSLLHKKSKTPLSPLIRGMQVAVVDATSSMAIVHGGLTADTVFDGNELVERNEGVWLLDMHALSWAIRYPPETLSRTDHVGVVLSEPSTVLVTFGGKFKYSQEDVSTLTWGYYPGSNVWVNYSIIGSHPQSRRAASALAVDNRSMIMIGGVTPQSDILNDVWMFTTSNASHVGKWTQLTMHQTPKRFGHTTVLLGKKIFLYGGGGPNSNGEFNDSLCSDELWELDTEYRRWQRLDYKGPGPGRICCHSATGKGEKMIIAGGCQWENYTEFKLYNYDERIEKCKSNSDRPEVWYYSITNGLWDKLAPLPFIDSAFLEGNLLIWGEEQLVAFGGYSVPRNRSTATDDNWYATGFWFTTLGCPEGTAGSSFWHSPCDICPFGRFAPFKSSDCGYCPRGTTTPHTRAASKQNCTLCDTSEDYCHYGECYVRKELIVRNTFERRCSCSVGFTEDRSGKCVVPTAYVSSLGVILAVFVACCVAFVVNKRLKARKLKSHRQLQELVALNQVWKINPREIVLRERIDGDSPGGFGEVYKAEYREMTVAVKKLRSEHNGVRCYAQEFDREIEVMRTLRHPNIVLFFGGGHFDDDNSPFLVVEYMIRGSLGAMLTLPNEAVVLTNQQKLKFALDAAEGMAFLHSRSPPRIHRDLKSFNLLVSDRWIVKVSDFGAARLVRQEGMSQPATRATVISISGSGLSMTTPLLDADATLSTDCGSLLWSAPELLDRKDYGTPVDVYR